MLRRAWAQDELAALEMLIAAGATVEEAQAAQLREGIHTLMRRIDWAHIEGSAAGERESVAEMARVLAAVGAAVGCDAAATALPDVAKAKPDKAIVASLCDMGFLIFAAQRAALATGNRGVEAALGWCVEHACDEGVNDPLPDD